MGTRAWMFCTPTAWECRLRTAAASWSSKGVLERVQNRSLGVRVNLSIKGCKIILHDWRGGFMLAAVALQSLTGANDSGVLLLDGIGGLLLCCCGTGKDNLAGELRLVSPLGGCSKQAACAAASCSAATIAKEASGSTTPVTAAGEHKGVAGIGRVRCHVREQAQRESAQEGGDGRGAGGAGAARERARGRHALRKRTQGRYLHQILDNAATRTFQDLL